jgi:hypothetical protein
MRHFGLLLVGLLVIVVAKPVAIGEWLEGINPTLSKYTSDFVEYGYDNHEMIMAQKLEDIAESLAELKLKKPHVRMVMEACSAEKAPGQ